MIKHFRNAFYGIAISIFAFSAVPAQAASPVFLQSFVSSQIITDNQSVAITGLAATNGGDFVDNIKITFNGKTEICNTAFFCKKEFTPSVVTKPKTVAYEITATKNGKTVKKSGKILVKPATKAKKLPVTQSERAPKTTTPLPVPATTPAPINQAAIDSFTASSDEIKTNETVTVMVKTAKTYKTIFIVSDQGGITKECTNASNCELTDGPFPGYPGGIAQFSAMLTNTDGILEKTLIKKIKILSLPEIIQPKLSASFAKPSIKTNETDTYTVTVNPGSFTVTEIAIFNKNNDGSAKNLKICQNTNSCSYEYSVADGEIKASASLKQHLNIVDGKIGYDKPTITN